MTYIRLVTAPLLWLWLFLLSATGRAESISLGAIVALTGDMAAWGDRCQKAYRLAQEELADQRDGFTIELHLEDASQSLPKNALTALQKLTRGNVIGILGVFSPEEVDAIAPVLERKKLALLSFVPGTQPLSSALFLWPDPVYEAGEAALALRRKYSKVAILGDTSAWTEKVALAFKNSFEHAGGTIVSLQLLPTDTKQVRTEVLRVKNQQPEALFIPSYYLLPQFLKELHALQVRIPRYSVELDESIRVQVISFAEHLRFLRPAEAQSLQKRFSKRFSSPADLPASYCYDQYALVYKILKRIPAHERTRDRLWQELKAIREYHGESGTMVFTGSKLETSQSDAASSTQGGTRSPLDWFEFTKNEIVRVTGP